MTVERKASSRSLIRMPVSSSPQAKLRWKGGTRMSAAALNTSRIRKTSALIAMTPRPELWDRTYSNTRAGSNVRSATESRDVMRLCRFEAQTGSGVGLVLGDEVADLSKVVPQASLNPVDILAAGQAGREMAEKAARSAPRLKLCDITLKSPVGRPGKILGIGLNYRDHAKETGREPPAT